MTQFRYLLLLLVTTLAHAAPENVAVQKKVTFIPTQAAINDLKTASSSYSHQYSNWGGNYPGGYGFSVTGVGTIDDKSYDPSFNTLDKYDSSIKNTYSGLGSGSYPGVTGYGNIGSGGYKGYDGYGLGSDGYNPGSAGYNPGSGGYNPNSGGYKGYDGYSQNGYGQSGYSPNVYGTSGYGSSGLEGGSGYFNNAGYGVGNGGYGGYGGNGGLISYYGYNNPYYQGGGHLGYGYYGKKPGYGNIYSSGVTPSLVTGYRGYTRR